MALQDRDDEDKTIYKVVVNDEEQYSIWPDYRENPQGWKDAGKVGPKAECLAYIKEVWTDMRPLSLRKKMEEMARNPPAPVLSGSSQSREGESLVDRLCAGDQPFVLSLRPEPTLKRFKEALEQGYLRIKFTGTNPGTELGVRLDKDASDFKGANFDEGTGSARAVGDLTLDYVRVRCVANIDLETLAGHGRLEKVEAEGSHAQG
jgi:uncharacterized protein YbdZ (MbtH family)